MGDGWRRFADSNIGVENEEVPGSPTRRRRRVTAPFH